MEEISKIKLSTPTILYLTFQAIVVVFTTLIMSKSVSSNVFVVSMGMKALYAMAVEWLFRQGYTTASWITGVYVPLGGNIVYWIWQTWFRHLKPAITIGWDPCFFFKWQW
jgi:hypothetical protein